MSQIILPERGNRTRITYPDSKQVNYSFDDANRMKTVTDWDSNVTTYSYDDAGRWTQTELPTGVVESKAYNPADQLTDITAVKGQGTLTDFTYGLDNAGMRTSVTTPGGIESYSYDDLYRLTGVTYPDQSTQSYSYDNVGNRLTKVEGSTTSYVYDNADRMTSAGGVTYTYDNNGNQTGRGSDIFGWDVEDRMTSATVNGSAVTYIYRGDDLRHSKTVGGVTTTYTWDLNSELPVVLQESNISYVYGLGLISQQTGTTNSYFLADGLGSTAALTDDQGTVTATYKYDVFGAVKSSTGTGSADFRFAGQQDDPTLGYQYLRARYYDPSIGRFLTKDPFGGFARVPLSQNAYAYAHDNPINSTDPSGQAIALAPAAWLLLAGAAMLSIQGAASQQDRLELGVTNALNRTGEFLRETWSSACKWVSGMFAEKVVRPPIPADPAQSPGRDWEWRGNGPAGSKQGSWHNPGTDESLHPDLDHPLPIGPHWDYIDKNGDRWRVYPDGRMEPK